MQMLLIKKTLSRHSSTVDSVGIIYSSTPPGGFLQRSLDLLGGALGLALDLVGSALDLALDLAGLSRGLALELLCLALELFGLASDVVPAGDLVGSLLDLFRSSS